MAGDNDGNVVSFPPKVTVKQTSDKSGMSPSKSGIIVQSPVTLYTVRMHHQDASLHPWLFKFTNPWHTGSECTIVTAEAFRLAIVQKSNRNITDACCREVPFRRRKLYNCSGSTTGLGKSVINELKCRGHPGCCLRAKHCNGFPSSFSGEPA